MCITNPACSATTARATLPLNWPIISRSMSLFGALQGKIERWHQTLWNCIGDLEAQIGAFVEHYSTEAKPQQRDPGRRHVGRATHIVNSARIERQNIQYRRLPHRNIAA